MVFLFVKTPRAARHILPFSLTSLNTRGLEGPSLALLAALILALIQREDVRLTKLAAQLPSAALGVARESEQNFSLRNLGWIKKTDTKRKVALLLS
ncbi:hypothetical protein [Deinococcus ruber]|uniref:Uncharacterized protein n=1 Tax=Deinococcus ruber TaxID=1848197 RepID=A0A918F826_9DEIO|nr:hypothetical protein [Deinococcus ruber]GGR17910.1 hypothetical protein GCM10008957_33330 [Deinococcus ruber]